VLFHKCDDEHVFHGGDDGWLVEYSRQATEDTAGLRVAHDRERATHIDVVARRPPELTDD
jgi:hypothetical protein